MPPTVHLDFELRAFDQGHRRRLQFRGLAFTVPVTNSISNKKGDQKSESEKTEREEPT
jgi:hypothetical protein